jgi:hypothetical protein
VTCAVVAPAACVCRAALLASVCHATLLARLYWPTSFSCSAVQPAALPHTVASPGAGNAALRHLDIAYCSLSAFFTAECLEELPSRSVLQHLDVSGNFVRSRPMLDDERAGLGSALATLTALTFLGLNDVAVAVEPRSSLFPYLTGVRSLAALSVRDCYIPQNWSNVDVLIKQIAALTALTALTRLDLRENYWNRKQDADKLVEAFDGTIVFFEMQRGAQLHPDEAEVLQQMYEEQVMDRRGRVL